MPRSIWAASTVFNNKTCQARGFWLTAALEVFAYFASKEPKEVRCPGRRVEVLAAIGRGAPALQAPS